jgi:hypothetical protein
MKPKETKVTRENLTWLLEIPVEVKMEQLQSHLSVCQLIINQILEECQNSFARVRYDRNKLHGGRYSRWGYNEGVFEKTNHSAVPQRNQYSALKITLPKFILLI